jgi:hypothetical protein
VQTGNYKEPVVGIKMAIVHRLHPDVNLDQAQTDTIQEKTLQATDASPLEQAPPQSYIPNLHRECFGSPVQMNLQRPG